MQLPVFSHPAGCLPDWPPELEQHYGVPWLKVRAGVHLCTDVSCVYEEVSQGYGQRGAASPMFHSSQKSTFKIGFV